MNREILFRGKRTEDNGEWVEGYLCECHHKDTGKYDYAIQEMFENGYIMHEVIPETVGQYTGLTDKNGKKIFEGDILHAIYKSGYIGIPDKDFGIGVIKYGGTYFGGAAYLIDTIGEHGFRVFSASLQVEVIGNVHDNPELMEVQHE